MWTCTDRIIVVLASVGVIVSFLIFWRPSPPGAWAEVRVDGRVTARLDLSKNGQHTIVGPLGPSRLEILDGQIRFITSPCTGKQCLRMGWASHGGEFLACLPNRVSVTLIAPEMRYDAINF